MLTWSKINLESTADIRKYVLPLDIQLVSIDTETTGLHIILDKPFLMTFGIYTKDEKAYAFSIPITSDSIMAIKKLLLEKFKEATKIIFFNAKYDCHMLYNVGLDLISLFNNKITDVSIYARLGLEAISPREGGPVLSLKTLAQKFIDKNAKVYEHKVAMLKKDIKLRKTNKLKSMGVKMKDLDTFLSDKINDVNDLPPNIRDVLTDETLNPDNYSNIDLETLKEYAVYDAIYTLELFLHFVPIVEKRDQLKIVEIEEKNIPILWRMERCGFKLNKSYLYESKNNLKKYIIDKRNELKELSQTNYKIGQHKLWKDFFYNEFGIFLEHTDEDGLSSIQSPERAKQIAELIIELRSLEKWYSTYICKWETDKTDRIYTSFNQTGAVSGRFSSDFQQFPKEPLLDKEGNLVYNPRRLVQVSGNGYNSLVFIDFSSEELRIQALYTILVGSPDLNLCRAYMPYQCKNEKGKLFDYNTDLKTFNNYKWYLIEKPEVQWVPTDLHDATTFRAFPELKKGTPEFKHYRKMAKCTNFA